MEKRYDKGQIETVVLQAVLARPYKEFGGCRIYPLHAEGEEAVVLRAAVRYRHLPSWKMLSMRRKWQTSLSVVLLPLRPKG